MSDDDPRPVPRLLIWGLVGGFVLFVAILIYLVINRQKLQPEAPHASESRSESAPQ